MIGTAENFRSSSQSSRSKPVRSNVGIGTSRRLRFDIRQPSISRSQASAVGDEMAAVLYSRVPRRRRRFGEFMNSRAATSFVALNNPCRFGRVAV